MTKQKILLQYMISIDIKKASNLIAFSVILPATSEVRNKPNDYQKRGLTEI